jgi:hypothetical protein
MAGGSTTSAPPTPPERGAARGVEPIIARRGALRFRAPKDRTPRDGPPCHGGSPHGQRAGRGAVSAVPSTLMSAAAPRRRPPGPLRTAILRSRGGAAPAPDSGASSHPEERRRRVTSRVTGRDRLTPGSSRLRGSDGAIIDHVHRPTRVRFARSGPISLPGSVPLDAGSHRAELTTA